MRGDACLRFLVVLFCANEQMNAHSGAIPKSLSSLSESHLHCWNGLWYAFFLLGLLALGLLALGLLALGLLALGTNENGEISSSLMSGIAYAYAYAYVYVYYIMHAFISLQSYNHFIHSFHKNITTK